MAVFHIDSEVGRLRRVMVHRPGPELTRLVSPTNGLPRVERARLEHDVFVAVLEQRDVVVHLFQELFAEVLHDEWARSWVLHSSGLSPALREVLAELPPADLARTLIAGVTRAELARGADTDLCVAAAAPEDFLLPPLPNHVYTRDPSCWLFGGRTLNPMARTARHREGVHVAAVYRFHPLFAGQTTRYLTGEEGTGSLEGGDVHVLAPGVLLVGLGGRTTPDLVQLLAARLFSRAAARAVIVAQLPPDWPCAHLDTAVNAVDATTFVVPPGLPPLRSFTLHPGRGLELVVAENDDLFAAIARELGLGRVRVLRGEGNNLLAVEPGVVLAGEGNTATNSMLREHGIDVITVPAAELARSRGGPRSLSCPLERDPCPDWRDARPCESIVD